MWRYLALTPIVVGCITVVEDKTPATTDGDTGAPTEPTTPTDPTDPPDGGSIAACAGTYAGTYTGADSGTFEATVDPAAMQVLVVDVDDSGGLNGIADLEADGSMYGESAGFWIDGSLDVSDCSMRGDWGVVGISIPAGTWETDP